MLTCRQQNHCRHPFFVRASTKKLETNEEDKVNAQTRSTENIYEHDEKREGRERERIDAAYEQRGAISRTYPQKLQGQQRNKDATAIQEHLQCHTTTKKKCKQRRWSKDNYGNNNTDKIRCNGPGFLAFLHFFLSFASQTALSFERNSPSNGK